MDLGKQLQKAKKLNNCNAAATMHVQQQKSYCAVTSWWPIFHK